ncbi:ABC transporter substrate-binding protein/permease [Anaerococcus sp. AGMB00486]|uniref:ABC transporter substrate-binding protein/permease n=1 Tax=Anaerococcus faecalis TaxID=2742993 RepID=A0ABX2NCD7_9FIRM|nr:ABC transporter substrate-binding protein/permease [Anaerococcus faecalis]NVF12353.1 ABC transporter substrate-binding protein/permease [Anaerococcus faecalis]
MKKFRRFFLAFIFIFVLNITNSYASEDTFKVGMEVNYAPFNFSQVDDSNGAVEVANSKGEYANGIDVQTAKMIADKLGKKLEIYKIDWDGLPPALTSGKIDAIIAGMSPTAERKKEIDFTSPYYFADLTVVVKKNSKYMNAKSINDFKGAKLTGQLNTFHYDLLDQMQGIDKQTAMDSFPTMISATKAGSIDGYVSEKVGALSAVAANPDLNYVEFPEGKGFKTNDEDTTCAVGLVKNSPMNAEISKIVEGFNRDDFDKMMEKMVAITAADEKEVSFFGQMKNIWDEYSSIFIKGIVNTLLISIIATSIGFIIGLLVTVIRKIDVDKNKNKVGYIIHKIVNFLLSVYVEVFRSTPMMVQAMLIFYGAKQFLNIDMSTMFAALMIVSINTGAYLSEVVRGGINAVDKGQFEACKALGMTHSQTMFNVVIPQAIKSILPSIGNEFVINIKDTSVLNVISVTELFFVSKSIAGSTYQIFQTYLITAIIYFILTFVVTRIIMQLEKRYINKEFTLESSTGGIHGNNN